MSMMRPLTCSIHTAGLSASRLGNVHSGDIGPIPRVSLISLDLFCPVLSAMLKNSKMIFGLQCGICEGSSRKLTRPTAWMAAAAHALSLPLSSGVGRFLARLATTRRISVRYSSLRCFSQKSSVSAVMDANFSAMVRGIFTLGDMVAVKTVEGAILTDRLIDTKWRREFMSTVTASGAEGSIAHCVWMTPDKLDYLYVS